MKLELIIKNDCIIVFTEEKYRRNKLGIVKKGLPEPSNSNRIFGWRMEH